VPLYFVALLGFASAIVIWLLLPERSSPRERRELPKLKFNDPRVLPFIIFGVAMGTAGAIPIQTIGFLIGDILKTSVGDTTQLAGVGLMASSIASLFAQFVLVQRFKLTTRFLMRAGTVVALGSNLIFLVAPNYGLRVFALCRGGVDVGAARRTRLGRRIDGCGGRVRLYLRALNRQRSLCRRPACSLFPGDSINGGFGRIRPFQPPISRFCHTSVRGGRIGLASHLRALTCHSWCLSETP